MTTTNVTNNEANYDQFETVLESISANMNDWWANMLIGRIWNSAQMSAGSAGDKKAMLDIELANLQNQQDDETARGIAQMEHPVAIQKYSARIADKYAKRITKVSEDVRWHDDRIEQAQNIMAVLNDILPKFVDSFVNEDADGDHSAVSTTDYLMNDVLTNEDDIRIEMMRFKQPSLSTAKAFDAYYSQSEEAINKCETSVERTINNIDTRRASILSAIHEARVYAQTHGGKAYEIDSKFMTNKIHSIDESIAKRLTKVNSQIEKAHFKLLESGMSAKLISTARTEFKATGKYNSTDARDLFQMEDELAGLYVVTADLNTITKDLNVVDRTNTMLEPLQVEKDREDELKQAQA